MRRASVGERMASWMATKTTMLCLALVALVALPAMGRPAKARHHATRNSGKAMARGKRVKRGRRHGAVKKEAHFRLRQTAPSPDRVGEIQTALTRNGFYSGDATGKWDAGTVDAVQRFQQQNGLEPSGKLDALTLQKLGLGSDVAGLSPPRPQESLGEQSPAPVF